MYAASQAIRALQKHQKEEVFSFVYPNSDGSYSFSTPFSGGLNSVGESVFWQTFLSLPSVPEGVTHTHPEWTELGGPGGTLSGAGLTIPQLRDTAAGDLWTTQLLGRGLGQWTTVGVLGDGHMVVSQFGRDTKPDGPIDVMDWGSVTAFRPQRFRGRRRGTSGPIVSSATEPAPTVATPEVPEGGDVGRPSADREQTSKKKAGNNEDDPVDVEFEYADGTVIARTKSGKEKVVRKGNNPPPDSPSPQKPKGAKEESGGESEGTKSGGKYGDDDDKDHAGGEPGSDGSGDSGRGVDDYDEPTRRVYLPTPEETFLMSLRAADQFRPPLTPGGPTDQGWHGPSWTPFQGARASSTTSARGELGSNRGMNYENPFAENPIGGIGPGGSSGPTDTINWGALHKRARIVDSDGAAGPFASDTNAHALYQARVAPRARVAVGGRRSTRR